MSNFEKAIEIIMAEPTELHYPAYFADLLRKADVPDKDVGKCSEIPNGSDLISRQAAIRWVKTECNPYGKPTLDFESGKKVIEHLEQLPSAEPDIAEKLYQHKCYITDQEGLQHEVIHVGDIRRVTGWEI